MVLLAALVVVCCGKRPAGAADVSMHAHTRGTHCPFLAPPDSAALRRRSASPLAPPGSLHSAALPVRPPSEHCHLWEISPLSARIFPGNFLGTRRHVTTDGTFHVDIAKPAQRTFLIAVTGVGSFRLRREVSDRRRCSCARSTACSTRTDPLM
jgi:hypothetical protein